MVTSDGREREMYKSVEDLINKYEKDKVIPEGMLEDIAYDFYDGKGTGAYYTDKNGEVCYSYTEEEIYDIVKNEAIDFMEMYNEEIQEEESC